MIRTQIQLTEEQARELKRLAATEQRSMAEMIRQSVDAFLRTSAARGTSDRRHRALAAIGRFRSDVDDLAREHDRYLSEAFEE
ncbi:MAG: ribbon-helix-helix protein, CopG family [Acidobacteriota bacterium]|nr:ribbon-helix-helix protein, CopG family [Acidobacteriota bacterium]